MRTKWVSVTLDLYHSIGPLHKPRSVKIGFEDQVGGNLPSSYWQCGFHRSYFQKRGMNIYFSDGHEISSKGKTAHREVKLDCNHETPIYTESIKKKKPGQRDTEKGPLGPNSVPGKQWPRNQSAGRVNMTHSWVNYIWPYYLSSAFAEIPGHFWPGTEHDPFQWTLLYIKTYRVSPTRDVLRVHVHVLPIV